MARCNCCGFTHNPGDANCCGRCGKSLNPTYQEISDRIQGSERWKVYDSSSHRCVSNIYLSELLEEFDRAHTLLRKYQSTKL